jgi:hypothetical protein
VPTTLQALGLCIRVGHKAVHCCPHPGDHIQDFTVLHTTGIHIVNLSFCGCKEAVTNHVQLLCSHWWPATVQRPRTAATLELLKTFRILNLQARANATDFYRSLEHLTHKSRLDKAQVSARLPHATHTDRLCFDRADCMSSV